MDVQMSLIAIGVACATAIAVYLVSVFGIREKSFEEAIAEQKKRSDDLLGTHHHHKKEKKKLQNKDKNSNKKLKKREKLNNNVAANNLGSSDLSDGGVVGGGGGESQVEEEIVVPSSTNTTSNSSGSNKNEGTSKRSHVEIVDEPEILEPDEDDEEEQQDPANLVPPKTQSRRSSVSSIRRDSIIKSILLNKDEASITSTKEQAEPANHFDQIVPKDDCELKKSNSEQQLSTPPSPRLGGLPPSGSNTPVEETTATTTTTTDSPQVSKRSRSKQKKSQDDDSMTAGKIEKAIDRLPLTSSEIQQLIDVLLNKQHAGESEWINKGKGDTVGALKKQLELKDKMIVEEQASVSTLQAKLKELRNEFSSEKNKWGGVRRTLEEQVQAKVTELQNLQLRLKQMSDIGMSEKQELQRQLHRMQIKFKDVQEEYEAMKADYRNYREAEQTVRSKADTMERESGALKTQCGHLENQLKNAFASNQEMSNQLRGLQEHIRVMEERKKNDDLMKQSELRKLQEREAVLLQELAGLKTSLSSCENENRELRNQLNVAESSVKGADEINKKYEELKKSEVNLKNLVNELKGTVGGLEDQLKAKDGRIAELEKENERVKLNGDVQHEVDALRKELENEQQAAKGLRGQLEDLKKEVDEKQSKNDELRHKNQKLLESLQVTEQSLQSKIEASEKLVKRENELKSQASGVINQILGDDDSNSSSSADLSKEDWLIKVLSRVQEKVTALKNAPPPEPQVPQADPREVEELKQKSSKLEDEVVHYQGMLKETENLLSTLQASINAEEAKWVLQTAEKDKEIERLRSVTTELKELEQEKLSKVKELEERLGNASATSSDQVEQLKKSNETLRSELETTKAKCEQLSIALAKLENTSQPAPSSSSPPSEPYTNGSTTTSNDESSISSNNELVKQQQLSPPVSPNNVNNSTTTPAPPSPNPSASSPGSVGKEKKKKKNSSRK